ncbi:accessory factor associated with RNA polymerase II [Thoreauomyces humboldtii]|nr:accessory factor associated with RNA polymerase II [Thoreauomyces humboldtii]
MEAESSAFQLLHYCHTAKKEYILVGEDETQAPPTDPRVAVAVLFPNPQVDGQTLRILTSAKCGFKEHDVSTLLFFYQNRELPMADYLKLTEERESFGYMDRIKVLELLQKDSAMLTADRQPVKRPLDGGQSTDSPALKKPKLVLDSEDIEFVRQVVSRERTIPDDHGPLSLRSTTKTFASILDLGRSRMVEKHRKPTSGSNPRPARAETRHASSKPQPQAKPSSRAPKTPESRIPIIIVPSAPTARLTLWNVKQFLGGTLYIPTQKFVDNGDAKESRVVLERQLRPNHPGGVRFPRTYHVVDSADNIKPEEWPRVVAAFVTGQTWQFSSWKVKDPKHLFVQVKGFCLKYTDEPAPGEVNNWAVVKLDIPRGIRHNDYTAVNKFWDQLDAFILKDKRRVFLD